jgi:putative ABC transport system permease protein
VLLFLVTTVIAGFYPSLVLSGLDPQAILGGRGFFKHNSATVREVFTVLQFSLAVTLIVYCLTVNSQVHFFRHSDTGVARDNVIMIPVDDSVFRHFGTFRNELAALPGVRQTAVARYPLYGETDMLPVSANHSATSSMNMISIDQNFIPLLGLRWRQQPADHFFFMKSKVMVINESAVSKFGFPPDATGQSVLIGGTSLYTIAGVLNDFVFTTLKSKIEPLGLLVQNDSSFYWASGGDARLFIKVAAGAHMPELLASVRTIYAKYNNTTPFSFEFLDEVFNSRYKAEERLEMILNMCTPIVIFIACLGLFGLTYFNVNRKLKEISIRKVLGAERGSIVLLMCRNFLVIIGLSVALACPVAWYAAHAWLQNFPYHVEPGWRIFAATILGVLLISFVTILTQVLKAANANPVRNLNN